MRDNLIDIQSDECQLQIRAAMDIQMSASNSRGMKLMSDAPISRGFKARRQEQIFKNRLPPGQYATGDFPVLSAGPTPQTRIENWDFSLQSGGSLLGKWNWYLPRWLDWLPHVEVEGHAARPGPPVVAATKT